MKTIKKKAWPELFEKVLSGEKNFDLRLGNEDIEVGDILILEEWDSEKREYTGRKIEKRVSFVSRTRDIKFWPQEEIDKHGFVVVSF